MVAHSFVIDVGLGGFSGSRAHIVELAQEKVGLRMDNSGMPGIRGLGVHEEAVLRACRDQVRGSFEEHFVKRLRVHVAPL